MAVIVNSDKPKLASVVDRAEAKHDEDMEALMKVDGYHAGGNSSDILAAKLNAERKSSLDASQRPPLAEIRGGAARSESTA